MVQDSVLFRRFTGEAGFVQFGKDVFGIKIAGDFKRGGIFGSSVAGDSRDF